MKEADELIDHKREEVVKTVQEEVSKATGSTAEGFGAVLGKAKGLLNCKLLLINISFTFMKIINKFLLPFKL